MCFLPTNFLLGFANLFFGATMGSLLNFVVGVLLWVSVLFGLYYLHESGRETRP